MTNEELYDEYVPGWRDMNSTEFILRLTDVIRYLNPSLELPGTITNL